MSDQPQTPKPEAPVPAPVPRSLSPGRRRLAWSGLYVVVAGLLPIVLSAMLGDAFPKTANIIILAGIYTIAAIGLNIIVGYCGLLNLGFAGFMLIGAYTAAILMKEFHFSFLLAMIFSVAHGALWGILLGIPTLRLTGDYFAIVTFGFSEIVSLVALNWVAVTRGPMGYPGVPRPAFDMNWMHSMGILEDFNLRWQFTISDRTAYLYLVAILVGVSLIVSDRLLRSRLGRAWRALCEDEVAAESCGINAMWYKTIAFALSAAFGALAGAVLASYVGLVHNRQFDFMTSVSVLCYVVLGGMGTVAGPLVGAGILYSTIELLRESPASYLSILFPWWPRIHEWLLSLPWAPDMRLILYGAILILVIRFRPEGIMPSVVVSRELHRHGDADTPEHTSLFELRSQ